MLQTATMNDDLTINYKYVTAARSRSLADLVAMQRKIIDLTQPVDRCTLCGSGMYSSVCSLCGESK